MPRDLAESEGQTVENLTPLSRSDNPSSSFVQSQPARAHAATATDTPPVVQSPEIVDSLGGHFYVEAYDGDDDDDEDGGDEDEDEDEDDGHHQRMMRDLHREGKRNELHPFVSSLAPSHVEQCVIVEDACFPPEERASREKFQYRLTKCGELSLGVFTCAITQPPTSRGETPPTPPSQFTPSAPLRSAALLADTPTAAVAHETHVPNPPRKTLLLAHILATKSKNDCVKDDDMALPESWLASTGKTAREDAVPNGVAPPPAPDNGSHLAPTAKPQSRTVGHVDSGRTICIHSLAVLPQYQNRGLGRLLMRSYMSRIEQADVADRVALIAHDALVPFYESVGFVNEGPSAVEFAGGGWSDMVWRVPRSEEPPVRRLDLRDEQGDAMEERDG